MLKSLVLSKKSKMRKNPGIIVFAVCIAMVSMTYLSSCKKKDTTPPVIKLIGADTVSTCIGYAYIDAGATATDDVDGDITANIQTSSSVDTTTIGMYKVTYSVSDQAGNSAQENRIVDVIYCK